MWIVLCFSLNHAELKVYLLCFWIKAFWNKQKTRTGLSIEMITIFTVIKCNCKSTIFNSDSRSRPWTITSISILLSSQKSRSKLVKHHHPPLEQTSLILFPAELGSRLDQAVNLFVINYPIFCTIGHWN